MRCEVCKKGFTNGQEVIVVYNDDDKPVNCCGDKCAKEVIDKLKQGDMFGKTVSRIYRTEEMTVQGCRIENVTLKETKDGLAVVGKVTFPSSISIDQIRGYMGSQMTLNISTCHLDVVPEGDADAVGWREPEPMTMEHSLFRALMQNDGAEDRWKDRREIGMTDSDLTSAIGMEFGIKGTLMDADMQACTFEGDKVLKFWHDCPINGKPTLAGKKLVDKVRDVMGIPQPVAKKKTGTKKTSKAA